MVTKGQQKRNCRFGFNFADQLGLWLITGCNINHVIAVSFLAKQVRSGEHNFKNLTCGCTVK